MTSKTPLRVLLLEDSDDDAALLLRALDAREGGVVHERHQTAEGMRDALTNREWDIILSDWSMPRFSAPEALEILRESELDIPFIIVSGTVDEETVITALRGGARDFFSKDNLARLLPAIDRELQEAAVRRERAQMQEQLMIADRMASVGLLASGVAHEINNPLAAVLGNLELALLDLDDVEQGGDDEAADLERLRTELVEAQEAAIRIREVAKDLKLFARAEGDEDRGPADVHKVVESSLRMAQNEVRHRCRVTTNLVPVPPVAASESRLGQVMLNLIVNAAQSIPEGRADEHELAVATELAGDGQVVVEVRDTGAGIPPEVRSRLFTPFFTTKPIGVGTGLGLSICHRIVTSYGGMITVDSEPGKGSTFRVFLLPHESEASADQATTSEADEATAVPRRGSVLVIDDEMSVLMLVERILRDAHDVTTTTSAREAVDDVLAGRRYDVILCDLMMPHMTGMDVHEELAARVPDQAAAMVFLTGGAFTARAREFLEATDNRCVEKPFDVHQLRSVVNDAIASR